MAFEGQRRSTRIPKEIAILLVGSDMEGKVFSERTKTVVLSRHGAGIVSEYKLSPEQELILRCEETNKESEVRVVGQLGSRGNIYTYGVAFLDPNIDVWGIDFPASTESERQARRMLLQCSGCKGRVMVEQSDLESDVYLVNEGLIRYCEKCGFSTVWKAATGVVEDEPVAVEKEQKQDTPAPPAVIPETATPTEKSATPPANRRKHHRTKVNYRACVRRPGFDDDIVACEDMSRGGLCFKSRKRYYAKAIIEVAVPYAPNEMSIFVPAQIVHVEELTEEKLFRCGVAYLSTPKSL